MQQPMPEPLDIRVKHLHGLTPGLDWPGRMTALLVAATRHTRAELEAGPGRDLLRLQLAVEDAIQATPWRVVDTDDGGYEVRECHCPEGRHGEGEGRGEYCPDRLIAGFSELTGWQIMNAGSDRGLDSYQLVRFAMAVDMATLDEMPAGDFLAVERSVFATLQPPPFGRPSG